MKYSVILSNLNNCSDRYMSGGYQPGFDLENLFERLTRLKGISGVELVGGWHIVQEEIEPLEALLSQARLPVAAIIPDHFGTAMWGKGAFTNPDPNIRKQAIQHTIDMAHCARRLNCPTISIWNGQDGFDYPLQANYLHAFEWLAEGISTAASAVPDIQFSLEYKPKEPRCYSFLSNVWSGIAFAKNTGLQNVGVTVDYGHSIEAGENVSQAVCAAYQKSRLFHLHINDNYRSWDDDMITGSVHTIEYLELFYWLKKINYEGYISIDQYPYREDSFLAAQESLEWMKVFENAASRIDEEEINYILSRQDAVSSTRYIRKLICSCDSMDFS